MAIERDIPQDRILDLRELLEEDDDTGVIVYDLTSQDRIIRGRMPTLEIIFEKFVSLLEGFFEAKIK